jgi:hypothetical protein
MTEMHIGEHIKSAVEVNLDKLCNQITENGVELGVTETVHSDFTKEITLDGLKDVLALGFRTQRVELRGAASRFALVSNVE